MIPTSYFDYTASVTADQIAEALGCEHYTLGGYEIFHMAGDTAAGFAFSGLGTSECSIYAYYAGAVDTDGVLQTFGLQNKFYYANTDSYKLFGADTNLSIFKGFIKGKSLNGNDMWECFSFKKGNNKFGYVWDKDSTYLELLSRNMTIRSSPNLIPLCPFFNLATGFYTEGGVYFTAHIPNSITATSTSFNAIIGGKEYQIGTNENLQYMNVAIEVES